MANGYMNKRGWYTFMIDSGLTESQADYVIDKISNAIRQRKDRHCCDNFRISINDNNENMYEEIRDNGCCGFHDETIILNDGTKVKFGFNYGH